MNWWGIFFSFGIPIILWITGIYYCGVEKGKEISRRAKTNERFTNI